jgi:transcription elongation GreA/GreB family factor
MSIQRDLRKSIEAGQLERVEDAWLEHLAEEPLDIEFFVSVARSLAGQGQEEQAAMLLGLVDETLLEVSLEDRLRLLEGAGSLLFPEAESLHAAILETLAALHPDSPSRAGLVERVGLHRATHDIPKTWEKVVRLRSLLQFDLGTPVAMKGKGVGRVGEVNLQLDAIRVDFVDGKELRVGFAAAPKLLQTLPEGHLLRRRLEEPEKLKQLMREEPGELLRLALQTARAAMTAAEIRELLSGVVAESDWSSWWSSARTDPRVLIRGQGRQTYEWAASGEDAAEAVRSGFESAAPADRIEMFRRNAGRDPELARVMADRLAADAAAAAGTDPGLALSIWAVLEKEGLAPEDASWSLEALVDAASQPQALVAAVGDRALRERILGLVRERRSDWTTVFRGWMDREEDPRLLASLLAGLRAGDPELAERFVDEVVAQPRKRPAAFVFLAELSAEDEAVQQRNPLRLLQGLVPASVDSAFASYRPRLRKLWEDGVVLRGILNRLDEGQAAHAHRLFDTAPIEEYLRQPYKNAIEMRFPSLARRDQDHFYATAAAIERRRAELKDLLENEIPTNRKAIETAREMGDLRENFEYKSARERHEFLSARASGLDRDLRRARVIDLSRADPTEVTVGSRARLSDAGEERVVTLLGPWESRPEDGVYSYDSELGRRMLGKKTGDDVEVEGRIWRLEAIEPVEKPG